MQLSHARSKEHAQVPALPVAAVQPDVPDEAAVDFLIPNKKCESCVSARGYVTLYNTWLKSVLPFLALREATLHHKHHRPAGDASAHHLPLDRKEG